MQTTVAGHEKHHLWHTPRQEKRSMVGKHNDKDSNVKCIAWKPPHIIEADTQMDASCLSMLRYVIERLGHTRDIRAPRQKKRSRDYQAHELGAR